MPFPNLQSFIQKLREEKEIVSITSPVDPHLEIAEIHRRVIAADGPALLFQNVKGKAFPVVTNLFGTKKRVDLAFGKKPEQFLRTAVQAAQDAFPPTLKKAWNYRGLAKDLIRVGSKSVTQVAPYKIRNSD